MTIEKLEELEGKIKEEIENAKNLSDMGVCNPALIPATLEGHVAELVSFSKSKLVTYEGEASYIDRNLQPLKNQIKDAESDLLKAWNQKERFVKNPAEGMNAIKTYKQDKKFKLSSLIFGFLFLAEFAYGYYIFKNIVLPDNTPQNYLTSAVVGLMVMVIGAFVKYIPDSFIDIQKYTLLKRIITLLAIVFVFGFIGCLVMMRETTASFDVTTAVQTVAKTNWLEILFNLFLLYSIIFVSAFFRHGHRLIPNALMKKKHDEGVELLRWYDSDHFYYKKAVNEYEYQKEKLDVVVQPNIKRLKEVLDRYTSEYMHSLKRQALTQFILGTCRVPITNEKEQGRKQAEELILAFQ